MEADAWVWKGVSSLIILMFQIEDPEWIEDAFRIEGMEPGLSWMLKKKGGGYLKKINKCTPYFCLLSFFRFPLDKEFPQKYI